MKKIIGFSLVELLIVIGVSMILAIITVPAVITWYQKDQFLRQTEKIIDTLHDARAAALAEKKCNSKMSKLWTWSWSPVNHEISLSCGDIDNGSETLLTTPLDENIKIVDDLMFFKEIGDVDWNNLDSNSKTMSINFISGNAQSNIFVQADSVKSTYAVKNIKIPFQFTGIEATRRTICYNRIEGFPTISHDENCQ